MGIFKVLKYAVKDFRNKKDKSINGVWIFCGLYGTGKTLSMSREALALHKKGYKVYSNYGLNFQEGEIFSWDDLTKIPPNSCICIDEISNIVNARDWKNMPPSFFQLLTQNRKMNIRLMTTAQNFDDVDKQFRTLVKYVIQCNKLWRFISNKYYSQAGYNHSDTKKSTLFTQRFFSDDELFNIYDTNEIIEKLKKNIA